MASVRFRSVIAVALLAAACSSVPREAPAVYKGHLELAVAPDPLVARPLGGDLYEFDFDIIMREAGGVDVRIEDFTVDAIAFRTLTVQSQTFPAQFIVDHGYPASIAAGKYLRFHFAKRWRIPTPLLLSGASIHVSARTIDANGRRDTSEVRIPVIVGG